MIYGVTHAKCILYILIIPQSNAPSTWSIINKIPPNQYSNNDFCRNEEIYFWQTLLLFMFVFDLQIAKEKNIRLLIF